MEVSNSGFVRKQGIAKTVFNFPGVNNTGIGRRAEIVRFAGIEQVSVWIEM